ncbi:MAG: hypothetical protein ACI97B_001052 [Verrucomicrobiales bacterium]
MCPVCKDHVCPVNEDKKSYKLKRIKKHASTVICGFG